MFNKNSSLTYSILLGFVIGSIPKVWPWKSELGENMLPSFSISENYLLYSIIIIKLNAVDPNIDNNISAKIKLGIAISISTNLAKN